MASPNPKQARQRAKTQSKQAHQMVKASRPAQSIAAGQIGDILKTGGVGAGVPAIDASLNQFAAANRQAQSQLGEALGRMGMGGTEMGQNIMQGAEIEGAANQNMALAQLLAPIFQQMMGMSAGLPAVGTQGMVSAAGGRAIPAMDDPRLGGLAPMAGALGQLLQLHQSGQLAPLLAQLGIGGGTPAATAPAPLL